MIFITSDTHFCHDRDFIWSPRKCTSVSEMNRKIVANWNSVVGKNDDVYLLGDVMLNNDEEGIRLLKMLHGRIHIALGNHDSSTRKKLYEQCPNVVELNEVGFRLKYGGYNFILSHYPQLTNNGGRKPLDRETISLCGHIHTSNPFEEWNKGRIFHCEMDANNLTPFDMDTVVAMLEEKERNSRWEFF